MEKHSASHVLWTGIYCRDMEIARHRLVREDISQERFDFLKKLREKAMLNAMNGKDEEKGDQNMVEPGEQYKWLDLFGVWFRIFRYMAKDISRKMNA